MKAFVLLLGFFSVSASSHAQQKEIEQLQAKRFGPDGEVFEQQKFLVNPIQNRICQAVQQVAKKGLRSYLRQAQRSDHAA